MNLNEIKPPVGATSKRKRVGRGNASGHGGTSTRGHKGHKSRKGFARSFNFEGGQLSLTRGLPKRGFTHVKKENVGLVNLTRLEKSFKEDNGVITPEILVENGLVKKGRKIKILGEGTISKKMEIHAHCFSALAKEKIEKAGGKIVVINVK